MKVARFVCPFVLFAIATALAQNPVPLINQPVVPDATAPGGATFALTVNGSGFVSGATVNWNGTGLVTTFVSESQLTATVPASDIATAGTGSVTVTNPAPGGGTSNVQYVSVAYPTSLIGFAPAVDYGSGGNFAESVVIADVNGDGIPDLLVANLCVSSSNCNNGTVGVLLGNGDGTFQTAVAYASGGFDAVSVAVADVNGDGRPDLLVVDQGGCLGSCIGVLLGNGDGTFQTAVAYGSGGDYADSVAVADLNGDGKPDLVVANGCSDANCDNGSVGVLLGNGDGTFQTAVAYNSGADGATSVAVADVNGDGKPDLLVANSYGAQGPGEVGVLLGNGDGTFQTAVTYGTAGYRAVSVAVADVNGDLKPDLLVANSEYGSVGVLLGNGDGTFQTAVPYYAGVVEPISLEIADINGDGKLDLILGNEGNPTVGVLLGNGDGTFQTAMVFGSGGGYQTSVAVADVNGDGKPDLALSGCLDFSCDSGVVSVFINVSRRATTTMLVSSLNPSSRGQAVTFTATVAGAHGAPTGTVSFFNGTTNIGNSNLNDSDVATLTTSTLAEGTRSITATYSGDANFAPGTSPVLFQVVQGSVVTLSPTSLGFGYQTVGIASAPQDVTLTNTGNVPLIVTSVGIGGTDSGDFAQTNDCPGSVAPKGSCRISVTFTPTAAGTRSAALRVANNAPGSPQNVPLNGSVRNFTVAANSPTSQTVTPGQAANFAVTVSPLDGFAEMVSLHCSGAPAQSTCTVTPSSVALDGTGAVIVNVAAVTAGASMAGTQPIGGPSNGSGLAAWAASAGMVGLGLMVALPNRCPHLRLTYGLAFLCLLSIGIMLPACGGGGGSSGGAGTPTGTYTLTVTGAYPPGSSTLTHTTTLMLIVR